jgi:MFS transporter, DHA1 family, multidrug resistance protein
VKHGGRSSTARPAGLRLFVILGGLTAFGPLSIDMYLPALPAIGRELGASESLIQLSLTGCLLGLAAGQVIAGPLSDTLGRRRPLLAGVAAYVLTSLLCALAPSAPLLVAFRVLQGLGGGAGIVIARAIVRDLYEGVAAARYFSRLVLVMGLAPILAPVLGGQLLRLTSWRGIFLTLALITALLWLAAASALPETLGAGRRREGSLAGTLRTFGGLARDTPFLGYALTGALGFGAMFAYISGSPFVLEGIYRASPQLFSLFFGLNAFGFMLASQVNGSLVSRVSPARLLALGVCVNSAAGLALLTVVLIGGLGLAAVLPPLFLLVSSVGFVVPNATALALSRHPEAAGTGSALLGVIQNGIAAAAAPLVGIAGVTSALPMATVIAGCGAGALTALLLVVRPLSRSRSGRDLTRVAQDG